MAGTKAGGMKAAQKNLERDPNFYRRIGRIGGSNGRTGGFGSQKVGKDGMTGQERAKLYGAKGGRISKRGPISPERKIKLAEMRLQELKEATI